MNHYERCELCGKGTAYCQCNKSTGDVMKKLQENLVGGEPAGLNTMCVKSKNNEDLTDMQVLRCIMAAIIYGEIRHEKFLQHDLTILEPKVVYNSVFEYVDGLIEASKL